MPQLELYGSGQCPYTQELREWLEWTRREFREYNVDTDASAFARMRSICGGAGAIPVLVEDGKVIQVGWQGRSCVLSAPLGKPTSREDVSGPDMDTVPQMRNQD